MQNNQLAVSNRRKTSGSFQFNYSSIAAKDCNRLLRYVIRNNLNSGSHGKVNI